MKVYGFGLSVIFILICPACSQAGSVNGASTKEIVLMMNIDQSQLAMGKLILRSEIHNNSTEPISFLPWNTPFDQGVNGQFLSIVNANSNEVLGYQGRMIKRRPPKQSDYLILEEGESSTNELDITTSYDFCSNTLYSFTFSGSIYDAKYKVLPVELKGVEAKLGDGFSDC